LEHTRINTQADPGGISGAERSRIFEGFIRVEPESARYQKNRVATYRHKEFPAAGINAAERRNSSYGKNTSIRFRDVMEHRLL
jgi:hypothetical protein